MLAPISCQAACQDIWYENWGDPIHFFFIGVGSLPSKKDCQVYSNCIESTPHAPQTHKLHFTATYQWQYTTINAVTYIQYITIALQKHTTLTVHTNLQRTARGAGLYSIVQWLNILKVWFKPEPLNKQNLVRIQLVPGFGMNPELIPRLKHPKARPFCTSTETLLE